MEADLGEYDPEDNDYDAVHWSKVGGTIVVAYSCRSLNAASLVLDRPRPDLRDVDLLYVIAFTPAGMLASHAGRRRYVGDNFGPRKLARVFGPAIEALRDVAARTAHVPLSAAAYSFALRIAFAAAVVAGDETPTLAGALADAARAEMLPAGVAVAEYAEYRWAGGVAAVIASSSAAITVAVIGRALSRGVEAIVLRLGAGDDHRYVVAARDRPSRHAAAGVCLDAARLNADFPVWALEIGDAFVFDDDDAADDEIADLVSFW